MLPVAAKKDKDAKDKDGKDDKNKNVPVAAAQNGKLIKTINHTETLIIFLITGDDTSDPNDSSLNTSDDKSSPGKRRVSKNINSHKNHIPINPSISGI